ncbi:hypothetical protein BO94DRAFT_600738, partial [Aspergillus sclerotioniger CBS 115572]
SILNVPPQTHKPEPAPMSTQSENPQPSPTHDPYLNHPVIGTGMTGIILQLGPDRVVKKPKKYQPGRLELREDMEYMNEINQQILENEIQIFKRLGNHKGLIPCFQTSQYGIELALAQGDLESYIETYPEPEDSLKVTWILSHIDTFVYVHSCKVFVDDIALRNTLILGKEVKLADFGQSVLLSLDVDVTSVKENGLDVRIEILHLGWILYSVSSWQVHNYYFFGPENHDLCWPERGSFPDVDGVLCGEIIGKCWRGEYVKYGEC